MPIPTAPELLALVATLPRNTQDDWASLDAEVEALAASARQSVDGPRIRGWMRFLDFDAHGLELQVNSYLGREGRDETIVAAGLSQSL